MNFDPKTIPLTGKHVIEASAGTGKTYSICEIVIRLLKAKMPVNKIVLVTFTEAATAELRKKIAERITEELPDLIANIDEMPIFTIHGFCKRLLSEFAVETGTALNSEIITEQSGLIERAIMDFWKKNVLNLPKEIIDALPDNFSPEKLADSLKPFLESPGAQLCGNSDSLQYKLAKFLPQKLKEEKIRKRIISFNDLITDAYDAVKNDNEKILFNAVQKRYDALFVDEFQDTDSMQFEIFDYLFAGKPFYMIGDPKQAIYRFRGGDIEAYLLAKKTASAEWQMNKNWRSEKSLVKGIEEIFKAKENPFEHDEIKFIDVEAQKDIKLSINDKPFIKPVKIWKLSYKSKEAFYEKTEKLVAAEISYLLSQNTEISIDGQAPQRIKSSDIAILTAKNDEARSYKKILGKYNISATIRRSDSVFKSVASDFLFYLLNAFATPHMQEKLKAVLTHSFCGNSPEDFDNIIQNSLQFFYDCKEIWLERGSMKAINRFLENENLWGKIARRENGERNITNLRHIAELLHKEEEVFGITPERLLGRFSELRKKDTREFEEQLETDRDAVQIMTVHTSKGLEFPIVFVVDILGKTVKDTDKPFKYHKDSKIVIDYEPEQTVIAKETETKEEIQESARLFYVALTRTKVRLYIAYGFKEKKTKNDMESAGQQICAEVCKKINSQQNIEICEIDDLQDIEKHSQNKEEHKYAEAREFKKKNIDYWAATSFTGLEKKLKAQTVPERPPRTESEFPAGAVAGDVLHKIFESADFMASKEKLAEFIERKLLNSNLNNLSNVQKEWAKEQVFTVLNTTLQGVDSALSKIKREKRIPEMRFWMDAKNIEIAQIAKLLNYEADKEYLNEKLTGYLNGAIDLIFQGENGKYYILDWKSNRLGADYSAYNRESMESEMQFHNYHLQYFIYTIALCRYLKLRKENFDYEKDFGGVYYIFLRGVDSNGTTGIYFTKPEKEKVLMLEKLFIEDSYPASFCLNT